MRICKLFVLIMLNTIEERKERNNTEKSPGHGGQRSILFVYDSALIVNLFVFVPDVQKFLCN